MKYIIVTFQTLKIKTQKHGKFKIFFNYIKNNKTELKTLIFIK